MTLRRWRGIVVGLTLAGAFALSASSAVAKPCHGHHSPHGNSEANQYSESVPGPCGDQTIGGNGSGHGAGGGGSNSGSSGSGSGIPPASITQLNHMGPAGVQAANLAQATSPLGPGAHGKGGGGNGGGGKGGAAHGGSSGSGTGAASTNGSDGAGGSTSSGGGGLPDVGNPIGALASLVTGGS